MKFNDAVRESAYFAYIERGAVHGHHLEDWIWAERKIRFEANYETLFRWQLSGTGRKYVGIQSTPKHCRFCKRSSPEVRFKKDAHVVPELLGNKTILSHEECDDCNGRFGRSIEDELGKMLSVFRAVLRVHGKNSTTSYKTQDGKLRLDGREEELRITKYSDDSRVDISPDSGVAKFNVPPQSFVPAQAFAAFMKIAFGLMPNSELPKFETLRIWLQDSTRTPTSSIVSPARCRIITLCEPHPDAGEVVLCKRIAMQPFIPYMELAMRVRSVCFQLAVPSDQEVQARPPGTLVYPFGYARSYVFGIPQMGAINLASQERKAHFGPIETRSLGATRVADSDA